MSVMYAMFECRFRNTLTINSYSCLAVSSTHVTEAIVREKYNLIVRVASNMHQHVDDVNNATYGEREFHVSL